MTRKTNRSRNRSRRNNGAPNGASRGRDRRALPKSSYREYLERCESAGRQPEDFVTYLEHARRWRTEYGPAKQRGDIGLMRKLEKLLCI